MEIAFSHPFERAPGPAIGRRLFRSALVLAAAVFLVVRAGLGSLAGPGDGGGFESRVVHVSADGADPLFAVPALAPGQTLTRDAKITVRGSPARDLRLFADVTGTGLARSLMVTVMLGDGRGDAFVPDEAAGSDGAVLYHGSLASFPASWADGIRVASARTSTFRFRVTLPERATHGGTAAASFVWEAREV
jgi:hypothetical protein